MARYRTYGALDDTPLTDADTAFRGFASRIQPSSLPQGMASYIGNCRVERGSIKVRAGTKALSTDMVLTETPVTLDFTLGSDTTISSITRSGSTATVTTASAHGYATGEVVEIRGADQTAYNGDFEITSTGTYTFTYAVSGSPTTPATGTMYANNGPEVFEVYQDQVRGACAYSDGNNNEGIVIATANQAYIYRYGQATAAIGYPPSEAVEEDDECELLEFLDKVYLFRGKASGKRVMSWDLNPANDFVLCSNASIGAGLIPIPSADWATHFSQRMVLPYGRDELIISDILDAETYSTINSQLRIHPGTADWLVGAHPFQELQLLVLYRKSLHVLVLDSNNLNISQVYEITRDVGCAARKTIATCGNVICWLTDSGVYQLDISNQLKLRGQQIPLSEKIQDIMDRVNFAYVESAVGIYFNNRYYLAVPLDGQTTNKALIVYNFLNQEWESVDTFPGDFEVKAFAVIDYSGKKRLHAVTSIGFVYLMEELDVDEWGTPSSVSSYPITGDIRTRHYLSGTYDLKTIKRVQLETNLNQYDEFSVTFRTSNPDESRVVMDSFVADETTDYTHRKLVGLRGVSGGAEITTSAGRPEFKAVIVESTDSNRKTVTYK